MLINGFAQQDAKGPVSGAKLKKNDGCCWKCLYSSKTGSSRVNPEVLKLSAEAAEAASTNNGGKLMKESERYLHFFR